jgi:hypothetical protein
VLGVEVTAIRLRAGFGSDKGVAWITPLATERSTSAMALPNVLRSSA